MATPMEARTAATTASAGDPKASAAWRRRGRLHRLKRGKPADLFLHLPIDGIPSQALQFIESPLPRRGPSSRI